MTLSWCCVQANLKTGLQVQLHYINSCSCKPQTQSQSQKCNLLLFDMQLGKDFVAFYVLLVPADSYSY